MNTSSNPDCSNLFYAHLLALRTRSIPRSKSSVNSDFLNSPNLNLLYYLFSINPIIEKINPTIPIPITSSPIPDEQREIMIAKSSIAIPKPIFFIETSPSQNSDLLSSSLYFIAYRKDSVFYETCRLGTTCNAKCPQMASPQKGSWLQPAQGKCSVPCMIWSRP